LNTKIEDKGHKQALFYVVEGIQVALLFFWDTKQKILVSLTRATVKLIQEGIYVSFPRRPIGAKGRDTNNC